LAANFGKASGGVDQQQIEQFPDGTLTAMLVSSWTTLVEIHCEAAAGC